jgi:hypothetical protein
MNSKPGSDSQEHGKWGQVLNRESLTWPNNPVERTAHSGSFFPCASLYLWAAAHRER